ncbi:ankyrin repeat-containing domain protein [Mycena polygramma]|nr:ankyrin repeat-containing domain protein [Mycena polygramma]
MSLQRNENDIIINNYHIIARGGLGGPGGTGDVKGGDGGRAGGPIFNFTPNNVETHHSRKEELQKWFQAIDMREKQRTTYDFRHKNSGSWFLTDTKFVEWKERPGCLWIRGNCELLRLPRDKYVTSNSRYWESVLSSIAIDHLFHYRPEKITKMQPATTTFGIAYFYFDFGDIQKQLQENMLRSIIMQLSEQSPAPYSVLDEEFKSCQGGKFPTYCDLLAMLPTILYQFTSTYIVLDALDECSEPDKLVEFISTLCDQAKAVHLLVASQPRTIFKDSAAFEGASVVLLEPHITHADISEFVDSELKLNFKLKHIRRAQDAAPKVVDKSNGIVSSAGIVPRSPSNPDLGRILDGLPNDLFGIYDRFLEPIHEDDAVHVATLLRWVAFSAEPATLLELDDALAIDFSNPDQWVFEPATRGRMEAVWDLLEGLVVTGPDSFVRSLRRRKQATVVTLAHSSVKDYIVSKECLEEPKHSLREAHFHTFLAQSCVACFLHFENNPLNASTLPQYPLAWYAARFWSHHLFRCHDRGVLQRSTMCLQHGSKQYAALNCVYDIDHPRPTPNRPRHALPPLHLCCKIGYVEGVGFLLDHGADANAAYYGCSVLQVASANGNMDIVRLLLEKGADVNAAGGAYGSALLAAVGNALLATPVGLGRNLGTVRFLLDHGVRADVTVDADGRFPLHLAAEYGYEHNAIGREFRSALQWAAWEGNTDIVRVLIEHGADVNAAGGKYNSALQATSTSNNMDIVCLLLEKGADVNAAGGEYGSALQAVSARGYVDTVHLLLEKGADVNGVGGKYGSALQGAASRGHMDIVRLLLEHGADINTAGGDYGSALQSAAQFGNRSLQHTAILSACYVYVGTLLKEKADSVHVAELCCGLQRAAIISACCVDVGAMLEEKADNVHVTSRSRTLQRAAVFPTHPIHVGTLLEEKVNSVHMVSFCHVLQCIGKFAYCIHVGTMVKEDANSAHVTAPCRTLQRAAIFSACCVYVGALLEECAAGADIDAAGRECGSVPPGTSWTLQAASAGGHVDIVRLLVEKGADVNAVFLLKHGADVNAVGGKYGSALQGAASKGHVDVLRILLAHRADVNRVNANGNSALQDAAWHGDVNTLRVLLEHGADVNTVDATGNSALQDAARYAGGEFGSALQCAAQEGHVDTVRVLLDHGADVNAVGEVGSWSALQLAAAYDRPDVVRILVEHGADVNMVDVDGETALQDAAWYGYVSVVRVLIEHGADINAAGGEYGSALEAASAEGHEEIAKVLREHGAHDGESDGSSEYYSS